jgi:hypothetical protein
MSQLTTFKALLGAPTIDDEVLEFYLDNAKDIICDIRNTDYVESQYLTTQIKIAIELFNKRGAEGQVGHSENGISRTYESSDLSPSTLRMITPRVKTPYCQVRTLP